MRVPLPNLKPNGAAPPASQVFAITGMCQTPRFKLGAGADLCFVDLAGDEPWMLVRRSLAGGAAFATLRVEWEGVFTLLSNDDEGAEALFGDLLPAAGPEEVERQWTSEPEILEMFATWLRMS